MAWTEPRTWASGDPLNESNLNTYIRDNQVALKAQVDAADTARALLTTNFVSREMDVSGANMPLSAQANVFGAPALVLTIKKTEAHILAGCQVNLVMGGGGPHQVKLRLRCRQSGTPDKIVDSYLDFEGRSGMSVSQIPTTPFLGFEQGAVTFTVSLSGGGGNVSLSTGKHLIWAMEL